MFTMIMLSEKQSLFALRIARRLNFPQKSAKNPIANPSSACITDTGISQKQGSNQQDHGLISNFSELNQYFIPDKIILTAALIIVT
jgi:hypothetical protein